MRFRKADGVAKEDSNVRVLPVTDTLRERAETRLRWHLASKLNERIKALPLGRLQKLEAFLNDEDAAMR